MSEFDARQVVDYRNPDEAQDLLGQLETAVGQSDMLPALEAAVEETLG